MKKHEQVEPSFFKWIRAVRADIAHDTQNMTAAEYVAYIHAKAVESRLERGIRDTAKITGKTKNTARTRSKSIAKAEQ